MIVPASGQNAPLNLHRVLTRMRSDTWKVPGKTVLALDGVRGLAILGVMLHHSCSRLTAGFSVQQFMNWLLHLGWAGVDLFFVLSGFLITGILLDSREAVNYFRSFYARRALRIFPLYYLFLATGFLAFPLFVSPRWMPTPSDRWLYFCYLTNWQVLWVGPWGPSVMAHLWSLAVEEQFYFCWPLVVWALRPVRLLPTLLVSEGLVIVIRTAWVLEYGPSQAVVIATISRMDGLLLGAVCAIVIRRYQIPGRFIQMCPFLIFIGLFSYIVMLLVSGDRDRFTESLGFPLLSLCFALVVLYAALTDCQHGRIQSVLHNSTLVKTGKYAYGLYIYHVPLFYAGDRIIDRSVPASIRQSTWFGYASTAILIAVCYLIAKLSYNVFECHFLKLKRKFEPLYFEHVATAV